MIICERILMMKQETLSIFQDSVIEIWIKYLIKKKKKDDVENNGEEILFIFWSQVYGL